MSGNGVSREVRVFFSRSNQFVYGLQMGHRVEALRERLNDIEADSKRFNFEVHESERYSLTAVKDQTTSSEPEVIVGREGDKAVIKSFLLDSNYKDNVSVISIIGMGGLGKTTLAQHVFNDKQVESHFAVKHWLCVLGGLDARKILKGLVGRDDDQLESLKNELEKKFENKKYLLVLDDVWDGEDGSDGAKWDSLKELFPRDAVGSKIVVTTRSHVIAKFTSTVAPHVLEGLSIDKSWELFRRKAFPQGQDSDHDGEWDGRAWESICRDFRRLRVLVLSDWRIEEMPPLIEKLKHLKYLDLSNNKMEALPNSVTNLVNLLVLKLNGCRYLKELPRGINKLINLRHLDVGCALNGDLCDSFEYMPRGIGKLTSLQTLSCFVVAKNRSPKSKMVGGLDELSRLNELRGSLEIRVEGYEKDSCISEFEGAKLKDKQYLQCLTITWRDIAMDSDIDLYDKMLQSLQPNSSLQELRVRGYGGMRLPSWLSSLSNLVRIGLDAYTRLEHIPPLDGIPSLEELLICSMKSLEYIDSEGVRGKEVSKFFPSLKKLVIRYCPSLKGWWKKSRGEMKDDSDESTVEELIMLSFPRLSSLTIEDCPNLTSLPLFPTLEEYLYLYKSSSMPLQQTMKMKQPVYSPSSSFMHPLSNLTLLYIRSIDDMESLPEVGLQNLTSLQQLEITDCSRLKSLPLHGQGMSSLQQLKIHGCPRLKSLSESKSQGMIPYLPSLQQLRINDCSEELSRGWGKESSERKNPFRKEMALMTVCLQQPSSKHVRSILRSLSNPFGNQSDHLKMSFSYTMQEMPQRR
ncbi:DISEASE RESISTANCE PROTEIN RP [Salix koriyanagi]|uniref:DISEASE RESISTANCE PROTEIN RP n=1 Tax=Salix koriyanagi TaxID=2511006 RepID=A0A9Q0VBE6_9ROSI|nr:DISEASE RESISTANCE PROTEIN RP [Salix koriyanagi]